MPRRMMRTASLILSAALCASLLTACSGSSPESQIDKAKSDIAAGKAHAALITLRSLVQKHPDNAQGRLLLGTLLFDLGDPGTAAAQLQQASHLQTLPVQAQFRLVDALVQIGKLDQAGDVVKAIHAVSDQDEAERLALVGEIALAGKRAEAAAQAFSASLAKNPRSSRALVGQAAIALLAGKPVIAQQKADAALAIEPKEGVAWLIKGDAAFMSKRIQSAADDLQKALEIGPPSLSPSQIFEARGHLAQSLLALGQRGAALKNVEAMLKQSPKHPYPNYLRGLIAYQEKHYDTAAQHLQTALNADPYNVQALTLLAGAEAAQGQDVLAVNHLTGALAQDPQNPQARRLLASLQLKTGEDSHAIQTILKGAATAGAGSDELLSLFASPVSAVKTLSALQANTSDTAHANTVKLALAQALILDSKQQQALTLLGEIKGNGDTRLNALRLRAAAYLRAKQSTQAIDVARQIVQQDGRNASSLALAAAIYNAAGADSQAESTLKQAHDLAPTDVPISNALATLALRKGKVEQAERDYQNVLRLDPKNLEALMSLARIDAIRGNAPAALKWLNEARNQNPTAVAPLIALGQYRLSQKQPGLALDAIQQAVALVPGNPDILTLLAKTQLANGQEHAAVQTFQAAASMAPGDPRYAMDLAAIQTILKQSSAAENTLATIVAKHPDYLPATRALAFTQWHANQHEKAFATAAQYAQHDKVKGPAESANLTGDLYMLDKNYAEAVKQYQMAFASAPSRDLALKIYQARSQGKLGHPAETLTDWLNRHPDDADMRAVLALYYLHSGDLKAAQTEYLAALRVVPDSPIVLNNLAWIISQNDPAKALPYAQKAHRLLPRNPTIADTLGWIMYHDGKSTGALPLLELAAQGAPESGSIQYHYAVVLAKTGHSQEAASVLQKTLDTKTDFAERQDARQLLQTLKPSAG